MTLEQTVLGYPLRAEITRLDEGWDVGLFGGCSTHVGAVTLAQPGGGTQTLQRPGHRDRAVSDRWAAALAEHWQAPVCVRCGIHYDNATKEQIAAVTGACDALLRRVQSAT